MALNFDLAGKTYEATTVTVSAEDIAAYAAAAGDTNPRYRPGPDQIAPPVFAVKPAWAAMRTVSRDPELGVENPLMILHGEQEFRYHRPLQPGDFRVEPRLDSVSDKGSGATFVSAIALSTPQGERVVEGRATVFVRGAGTGRPREASDRNDRPEAGEKVASFTSTIDADMPVRYAEVSGDDNPIHLDEDAARSVGLPGVINHGLGTLAVVSGGLVDHLAEGDAGRIRRLQVRFTAPVFPGEDVTTSVRTTDTAGSYLYEMARPDGTVAGAGVVEVI